MTPGRKRKVGVFGCVAAAHCLVLAGVVSNVEPESYRIVSAQPGTFTVALVGNIGIADEPPAAIEIAEVATESSEAETLEDGDMFGGLDEGVGATEPSGAGDADLELTIEAAGGPAGRASPASLAINTSGSAAGDPWGSSSYLGVSGPYATTSPASPVECSETKVPPLESPLVAAPSSCASQAAIDDRRQATVN